MGCQDKSYWLETSSIIILASMCFSFLSVDYLNGLPEAICSFFFSFFFLSKTFFVFLSEKGDLSKISCFILHLYFWWCEKGNG